MRKLFVYLLIISSINIVAQKFVEPSEQKQFNITVNREDCTIKTQMLRDNKKIEPKNNLTYLWYSSQKIMETTGGFDGKLLNGYYRSFYLNDQLKEQGTIRYGLKNKKWKFWYSDGKLKETITWKHGLKNGQYCIYNNNGQLMAKGNFRNDVLHGKFYMYQYEPSGIVVEKRRYRNGLEMMPKIKKEKPVKQPKEEKIKEEKPKKEKKSKKKNIETKPDPKIVHSL